MAVPQGQRRLGTRVVVNRACRIIDSNGYVTEALIRDISSTGARLEVAFDDLVPKRFSLRSCWEEKIAEVVWRRGQGIGVRFMSDAGAGIPQTAAMPSPEKRLSILQLRNLAKAR